MNTPKLYKIQALQEIAAILSADEIIRLQPSCQLKLFETVTIPVQGLERDDRLVQLAIKLDRAIQLHPVFVKDIDEPKRASLVRNIISDAITYGAASENQRDQLDIAQRVVMLCAQTYGLATPTIAWTAEGEKKEVHASFSSYRITFPLEYSDSSAATGAKVMREALNAFRRLYQHTLANQYLHYKFEMDPRHPWIAELEQNPVRLTQGSAFFFSAMVSQSRDDQSIIDSGSLTERDADEFSEDIRRRVEGTLN